VIENFLLFIQYLALNGPFKHQNLEKQGFSGPENP